MEETGKSLNNKPAGVEELEKLQGQTQHSSDVPAEAEQSIFEENSKDANLKELESHVRKGIPLHRNRNRVKIAFTGRRGNSSTEGSAQNFRNQSASKSSTGSEADAETEAASWKTGEMRFLTLKSSDGDVFELEESITIQSIALIKSMVEDGCVTGVIPLPYVDTQNLFKIIGYSRCT